MNINGGMKLVNLKITNNTANNNGGGMYLDGNVGDSIVMTNSVVAGNYARYGGGIYANGVTGCMTNITVTGNTGSDNVGLSCVGGAVFLRNSIVWNNRVYGSIVSNVSGYVYNSYNLVQNAAVDDKYIVSSGDPQFKNASAGDFRLKANSPAINKGSNVFYGAGKRPDLHGVSTDLYGNPRIYGQSIDLGAFESQVVPTVAVNDTVLTTVDMPVKIKVLANDERGLCSGVPVEGFKIAVGEKPKHGNVAFVADTLLYTPVAKHSGIDSLDYSFECQGDTVSARVYIMTVNPIAKGYRACRGSMVAMGFAKIPDVHYEWLDSDMKTVIKSSSDTIKRIKDNSGNPQFFYARRFWKGMAFQLDTVGLFPAADVTPSAADIRVRLCPASAPGNVYLTGFLDSLDSAGSVEWISTGVFPPVHNISTGEIHPAKFPRRGTFTYRYKRFSECATSSATGNAYVNIPTGKIPPRPDTVLICFDQAAAININSIFGLELGGKWSYDNVVSNNISATSLGAIIFNGQKAYQQVKNNAAYNVTYRGVTGKGFVFEYDYSGCKCLSGIKRIALMIF